MDESGVRDVEESVVELGRCTFDPARRTLQSGAQTAKLAPRSARLLEILVTGAGRVVSREQLTGERADEPALTANALHKSIVELRHAFASIGEEFNAVETVPRRGYRLTLAVRRLSDQPDSGPVIAVDVLPAASGGGRFGTGSRAGAAAGALVVALIAAFWLMAERWDTQSGNITSTSTPANRATPVIVTASPASLGGQDAGQFAARLVADLQKVLSLVPGVRLQTGSAPHDGETRSDGVAVEVMASGSDLHSGFVIVLTRMRDGVVFFSKRYESQEPDTRAIEAAAASDLIGVLQIVLDEHEFDTMWDAGVRNPLAWSMFHEAVRLRESGSAHALRFADDRFRDAIAEDPEFEQAYVELAATRVERLRLETNPAAHAHLRSEVADSFRGFMPNSRKRPDFSKLLPAEHRVGSASLAGLEAALFVDIQTQTSCDCVGWLASTYAALLMSARLDKEAAALLHSMAEIEEPPYPVGLYRDEALAWVEHGARREFLLRGFLDDHPEHAPTLLDLILLYSQQGRSNEAAVFLSRLQATDPKGQWYGVAALVHADAQHSERTPGSTNADTTSSPFEMGLDHFMRRETDSGISAWATLDQSAHKELLLRIPMLEQFFAEEVRQHPSYQALLETLGVGRSWTEHLRQRVPLVQQIFDALLESQRSEQTIRGS